MRYNLNEPVLLIDHKGLIISIAVVRGYEPRSALYRVNCKEKNSDIIFIYDVPEDQLRRLII